jgi:nucleotide-binding universal stress UspA family protein
VVDLTLAVAPEGGTPAAALRVDLQYTGQALLTVAAARLDGATPPWPCLRQGPPSRAVIATTRAWYADLLVLGSTAEAVLRHALCPIMVVRPLEGEETLLAAYAAAPQLGTLGLVLLPEAPRDSVLSDLP